MTDIVLFLLLPALTYFMGVTTREGKTAPGAKAALTALLFFFCLGLNEKYIPNMTTFAKEDAAGYEHIRKTRDGVACLADVMGEGDRVYFLNQDGKSELPVNTALYYLKEKVNNYLFTPWKFTQEGSIIRLALHEELPVGEFPRLLTEGGFTYLWIYESDDYLREALPGVISFIEEADIPPTVYNASETPAEEGIYRLSYEGNLIRAIKLEW